MAGAGAQISNLRHCPHAENLWKAVRRNASPLAGAFRCGDKWFAKITVNGRNYFLGNMGARTRGSRPGSFKRVGFAARYLDVLQRLATLVS